MPSLRFSALAVPLVLLLSACGGGGGGDGTAVIPPVTPTGPTALVASSTVANRCEAPRSGSGIDKPGTLLDEQTWVRSWIDETYLWYREVP
ncbi:MAG: peptidase S41, partial [Janthinobacterium sp.]